MSASHWLPAARNPWTKAASLCSTTHRQLFLQKLKIVCQQLSNRKLLKHQPPFSIHHSHTHLSKQGNEQLLQTETAPATSKGLCFPSKPISIIENDPLGPGKIQDWLFGLPAPILGFYSVQNTTRQHQDYWMSGCPELLCFLSKGSESLAAQIYPIDRCFTHSLAAQTSPTQVSHIHCKFRAGNTYLLYTS